MLRLIFIYYYPKLAATFILVSSVLGYFAYTAFLDFIRNAFADDSPNIILP